jgi:hypothetical protein
VSVRYEFRVYDAETCEEHASGESAVLLDVLAEARRYTAQYAEDGPVVCEVYEVHTILRTLSPERES